jgi:ABC-type nitrate/sulfonate/bicarbonate transport system substrate-binding protein
MKQKFLIMALAVVIAVTTFIGVNGAMIRAADSGLTPIKTWSRTDCTTAPFLIADKLGFFKEQGLQIIYTGDTQPPLRIASIINGNNDVGSAHPNTLAIARAGGAKVRGVVRSIVEPPANITDIHLQHMWWVTNKTGSYKTLNDIKNSKRKVKFGTLLRNACIDYLTDKLIARYQIPKDKVEWVVMPDLEQVLALKRNLIDVATPHPTFYKAIEDTGIANILITSRAIGGESAGTYLYYFSDDFIAKHPEEIKRFVIAIKKAERWINNNKEQTQKWVSEDLGVPVSANHYYSTDARIDDKQIQEWIDGSEASGALEKGRIKVSDIITHQFDSFGNP